MAIVKLQGVREKQKGIYYQLESSAQPIGIGGMGQVFEGLCVSEFTGATRPVAIKFLFDDLTPQAVERSRQEASIQLHNDNLIEMLGFIETSEKDNTGEVVRHYHVVSELLTGVSLDDLLKGITTDRNGKENPFAVSLLQDYRSNPEFFAKKIVSNVLSGLMALHDAGYIHRDIDPTNIMITDDGRIKLIDLGLAKRLTPVDDKKLTIEGKFMGKPESAAPEMVMGDIQHQNPTTDIYSVGILLYQCITGHPPFQGARHEVLEQQLSKKFDVNKIQNKNLRAIIAKATEKKQQARFQTCYEMRVALDTVGAKKSNNNMLYALLMVLAIGITLVAFYLGTNQGFVADSSGTDIKDTPDTSEMVIAQITNAVARKEPQDTKKVDKDTVKQGPKQEKSAHTNMTKYYADMSDERLREKARTDEDAKFWLAVRLWNRGTMEERIAAYKLLKDAAYNGSALAREELARLQAKLEERAALGDTISIAILNSR